jgi:hypothetical protein
MRITFSAIPAFGHLNPMVPLAAAAAAAGHEVTFMASGSFEGRLPVPVVSGVPDGWTLHDVEQEALAEVRDPADPFAWLMAFFGIVAPRHIMPRLLEHWAQAGRPDLVVHDGANIGAARAADQVGVPAYGFHVALGPPEFFLGMLRKVVDVPDDPIIDPRPASWLDAAPPEQADHIPIRSVAWSGPGGAAVPWLEEAGDGRTAYLTLGTVAFGAVDVLRRSVLEVAAVCSRVLVAAGPEGDPGLLGELPEHVQVERYVDQGRVLDHVDVAVHHGGSGTTLNCLAAGVPQVITPQGADQFVNAARVAELGLGQVVPNEAEPGTVGAAVERLLSDQDLLSQVQAVRDEIARMPHPSQVVQVLEARH